MREMFKHLAKYAFLNTLVGLGIVVFQVIILNYCIQNTSIINTTHGLNYALFGIIGSIQIILVILLTHVVYTRRFHKGKVFYNPIKLCWPWCATVIILSILGVFIDSEVGTKWIMLSWLLLFIPGLIGFLLHLTICAHLERYTHDMNGKYSKAPYL